MDGWMSMDVGWMNDNSVHSKISNRVIYFHTNCFVCVCVCFWVCLLSLSPIRGKRMTSLHHPHSTTLDVSFCTLRGGLRELFIHP